MSVRTSEILEQRLWTCILSLFALWVEEYRTGSGSDRVGLAINNTSVSWIAENVSLQ